VLTIHKTLVADWLKYFAAIILGPFDVVGPRHLPTMTIP